jgi:hypothetical protein
MRDGFFYLHTTTFKYKTHTQKLHSSTKLGIMGTRIDTIKTNTKFHIITTPMTTNQKIFGAIAIGVGFYAYKTVDNLKNQIIVGTPKIVALKGTKLQLQLPIQNLSLISLPFDSFNGVIEVTINGVKKKLADVIIAPSQRIKIPSRSTATIAVECPLNMFVVVGELYSLLFTKFDIKTLTTRYSATLKGNGFSSILKIPVNVQII